MSSQSVMKLGGVPDVFAGIQVVVGNHDDRMMVQRQPTPGFNVIGLNPVIVAEHGVAAVDALGARREAEVRKS
jgi:hypothetical protein